jgi:hypothetical protein
MNLCNYKLSKILTRIHDEGRSKLLWYLIRLTNELVYCLFLIKTSSSSSKFGNYDNISKTVSFIDIGINPLNMLPRFIRFCLDGMLLVLYISSRVRYRLPKR